MKPLINITKKQALLFACFLVFYEFLTYIANDMIMPGMIQVVYAFHGPESAVADSLSAYILGGASLQLILGPLSDRFGRRPVMIFGAVLFFLCTTFIAASFSMEQFIAARFFQGMGLCFISVIGYATLQEIFAEMDAIRLISIMANVGISAPLIGPLLGAIFINYFSWRWIFIIIGMFSLLALWGLWRFMPEPVGQTKLDGVKIKRVSLSPKVVGKNYLRLIMTPAFLFGSLCLGLVGVPCLAWIALSPLILITQAKLTVIEYGLWQIPVFGAAIAGNWYLRYLTHHYSVKKIFIRGSLITAMGILLISILPLLTHSYLALMPGFIWYFFGLGVVNAPLDRLILFSTPVAKGTTSALMAMTAMVVQAIGIEVANYFYAGQSNTAFGLLCGGSGILYLILAFFALKTSSQEN